ncbi:MAG: LacI family transcriptional regulator [Tenericutes bacterium HGW-Tenericutes-6]|nr:MAG: LacI family transcriptional regulator [Tenericutes bacterium HGW-Tenericutes-6]
MATITEIAKKTNVSIATVSRVLNYDKSLSISEDKRKLILETAENLDYQPPKRKKQNLKKPITLGLLHWYTIEQELDDTYYLSIRLGIERTCYEKHIELIKIFRSNETYDLDYLKPLDGVIAVGKFSNDEVKRFEEKFPIIIFVDSSPEASNYDSVVIDFESAMKKAIDHIIDLGHKNIGYIGGREYIGKHATALGERREIFFREYLKELNLFDERNVHVGSFTIESGYQLMKKAIEQNHLPSAFIIASDGMAIGLMKAAYEAGIRIPKDLSIIGFNDIAQSQYTIPPLTTVKVYKEFMGQTAVDLALERIFGQRAISKKVTIPTELVIRESCTRYNEEN